MIRNLIALNVYLEICAPYLALPNVTDICINREKEIWVEQDGHFSSYDVPELEQGFLWQFAQLVAESNQREISPEFPTLSAVLPNGLRCQFVVEPACEQGSFICAIRQKSIRAISLSQYFSQTNPVKITSSHTQNQSVENDELLSLYLNQQYEAFLKAALKAKKNILISGGTSTGKTTFLNTLLQSLPETERIITIETDREVMSHHRNAVHLLATEEGKSVATISMLGLLKSTLRLRPDRILVSEIREYQEAYPYLRAINSGHPGSLTTIHADSAVSCFDQLAFMMLQGGSQLSHATLVNYAKSIIHIVVQIKRAANGERFIAEVYFDQAEKRDEYRLSVIKGQSEKA